MSPTAAELMGRAYDVLVSAQGTLKAEYESGKYTELNFVAYEEQIAWLCADVLRMARVLE